MTKLPCPLLLVLAVHIGISESSSSCSHLTWPQKPFCENYPLHWAATTANVDELKNLIELGTNIDQKTGSGYTGNTGLHIGGRYGRAEVVRLLIRNGADDTLTNNRGEKPLDRARILFCRRDPRNTWCALAGSDYTTTLTLLQDGCLASGCNTGLSCVGRRCQLVTTARRTSQSTASTCGPHVWFWWSTQRCQAYPFHWAAVAGDVTEVARLLQQGTDVNLRDGDRYTPLMLAAWAGRAETVSLLLDHGADISLNNARGRTALILANKRFCSDPNSKGCRLGEVDYNETIRYLRQDSSSLHTTTTTISAVTARGSPCVRFQYRSGWYEASSCICCWNFKHWCAIATSPQGVITDWDYCNTTA